MDLNKIFLNKNRLEEIRTNIKNHINENYKKFELGKELEEEKENFINALRDVCKIIYTKDDLVVLEKHNLLYSDHKISFCLDYNKKVSGTSFSPKAVNLEFDKDITTKIGTGYSKKVEIYNIINNNKNLLEKAVYLYELKDRINCEIKDLTDAYMYKIYPYRTYSTLLRNYPEMKQFLPEFEKKEPTRGDKIIKEFEKECEE